jgi:hypothetical protein
VVRLFVEMRNLLGDSCLVVVALASGGDSIGEVQSLTLQVENRRSGLNSLCLANGLIEVIVFVSEDFLWGDNL